MAQNQNLNIAQGHSLEYRSNLVAVLFSLDQAFWFADNQSIRAFLINLHNGFVLSAAAPGPQGVETQVRGNSI